MSSFVTLLLVLQIAAVAVAFVLVVALIIRRFKTRKKEDFEKRNN